MTIGELRKIFKQIDYYRGDSLRTDYYGNKRGGRKLQDDDSSILIKVGNKCGYLTSVVIPEAKNKKGVGEQFVLVSEMENGAGEYDKSKTLKMKSMVKWLIGSDSLKYSKSEIILRLDFNGTKSEKPLEDVTFGVSADRSGGTPTHGYKKGAQTFFCDFEAIKELERKRAKKAIKWQDKYWTAQEEASRKIGYGGEDFDRKMKQQEIDRIKQSFKGKYGDDVGESKESEKQTVEEAAGKKVYLIIFDNTIAGIASSKPIAKKMVKELEDSEGDADIQEFDFDILVSDDERINVDL